jgi:hypothetical protein
MEILQIFPPVAAGDGKTARRAAANDIPLVHYVMFRGGGDVCAGICRMTEVVLIVFGQYETH